MTTAAVEEGRLKQGAHIDPLAPDYRPPAPSEMADAWRSALTSREFGVYCDALRLPGIDDLRAAIVDDLSTYYQMTPEQCVERCIHWEEWSVEEWARGDRSTLDGMREFYNSTAGPYSKDGFIGLNIVGAPSSPAGAWWSCARSWSASQRPRARWRDRRIRGREGWRVR